MKELILKLPDEFTEEQVQFIKNSAIAQIESEMRSVLKVPQADIDTVEEKVRGLKIEMGVLEKPKPEPKEEPQDLNTPEGA